MKSKSKSSTKPIYSQQLEGAANLVNSTAASAIPKMTAVTDSMGQFAPGLAEQFRVGDPGVNAARTYNTDVLSGRYLNAGNPWLDQMVSMTGNHTRNGVQAALGTRGLTGGSDYAGIIAKALADNEIGLRYGNYNTERGRMDTAAGMAPALSAAQYQPLQAMSDIARVQGMPMQAANDVGSTISNVLGRYTNTVQTQSPGLMGTLGGLVSMGTDLAGLGSGLGLFKFAPGSGKGG